jgi:hypothetical protein
LDGQEGAECATAPGHATARSLTQITPHDACNKALLDGEKHVEEAVSILAPFFEQTLVIESGMSTPAEPRVPGPSNI